MKYRKKPVVIDAVLFDPNQENQSELLDFLGGCTGWRSTGKGLVIPTLEGEHLASPGDMIIKGVKGEYYPCKPDIFAATYDRVGAPAGPMHDFGTGQMP